METYEQLCNELGGIDYKFSFYSIDYNEWMKVYKRYLEIKNLTFEGKEIILKRLSMILLEKSENLDISSLDDDTFIKFQVRNNLENAIKKLKEDSDNSKKLTIK